MRKLFRDAEILNVFSDKCVEGSVLVEDGKIVSVGEYDGSPIDEVIDLRGCWLVPGFIDAHMHVESTMLLPSQFAKLALEHGVCAVVSDPHEIANVAGTDGIEFMLQASEGLPCTFYVAVPSCVPATPFEESMAVLDADALEPFFDHPRVVALGEMMNYPGVIAKDEGVLAKISAAQRHDLVINGHAPLVMGADLSAYISAGVEDDHECIMLNEAKEKIEKGQMVFIRRGAAANNLDGLIDLFDEPYNRHCALCTDDAHPAFISHEGHIDGIIRRAIELGKSPYAAYRMASLQAARHYGLKGKGAIAPGYDADFVVLSDFYNVRVRDVYVGGQQVVSQRRALDFPSPQVDAHLRERVMDSCRAAALSEEDFYIEPIAGPVRCIDLVPGQLMTYDYSTHLDFGVDNGIDAERDIVKIAVIERHKGNGHMGVGYVHGYGLKRGAVASTVSHDAHNLVVVGANHRDMAAAANMVWRIGGGMAVVLDGSVLAYFAMPVAGLMTELDAEEAIDQHKQLLDAAARLGGAEDIAPFMHMGFASLTVIPKLRMTTYGLFDVDEQKLIPLACEEE